MLKTAACLLLIPLALAAQQTGADRDGSTQQSDKSFLSIRNRSAALWNQGHTRRNIRISKSSRQKLNEQEFKQRIEKFREAWEEWRQANGAILQALEYDRELFGEEEKLWRKVEKRMAGLMETGVSEQFLKEVEVDSGHQKLVPRSAVPPSASGTASPSQANEIEEWLQQQ